MKIRQVNEYIHIIEREGKMHVPVKIFASSRMLAKLSEDRSLAQGMNMATLPGIEKEAIMLPDAHEGYGFPIGGVGAFNMETGCISPGGIGYDINCGVRLLVSQLKRSDTVAFIDRLLLSLSRLIPGGVGSKSGFRLSPKELDEVLNLGIKPLLAKGYGEREDGDHCEEGGSMKTADASCVSSRAKERGASQLGTLGAGNHFLEVQRVEEIFDEDVAKIFGITSVDQVVVMIHCGSRGLGHQVCSDYIKRMEEEQPEILESLVDRELIYAPIGTLLARDYFAAMSAAANFGWANRHLITHQTRKAFREVFGEGIDLPLIYDVAHNIAKIENRLYVHRKGATRAFGPGVEEIPRSYRKVGQPVIIPGSMGTASYLLVGTASAMEISFGSTPHGAGRILSRHKALKLFRGQKIKEELLGRDIHLIAGSLKGVAEEAPGVYKDIDEVVEVANQTGIGRLVARLRPMGVIKG